MSETSSLRIANEVDEPSPASFVTMYQTYLPMVRNVLYRMTGTSNVDDLTQDTFERVWKNRPAFRKEADPRTWVYRMAANAAIDHLRKQKHRNHLAFRDDEKHATNTADGSDRDLVQKGLMALSEDHRIALVLHAIEGLTHDEIAEMTRVPVGTVKSRIHYAREEMKSFVAKAGRFP